MSLKNKNIDHDLLMIYLLGDATDEQNEKVDAWLQESEDNKAYLDELEQIWIETGKLDPAPIDVNVDAAWKKVDSRLDFEDKSNTVELKPKTARNINDRLIRIAAIMFLLAGALFIIKYFIQEPTEQTLASNLEIINDTLPDGSLIALNKKSSITYPKEFDDDTREVVLKGEAFFNVERNEEKAFIIHADNANIKVLGTSFNVKALPNANEVEVVVESGTVMLFGILENGDTSSVILNAGEKGVLDNYSKKATKLTETISNEVFWNKRKIIFEETELSKVFEILEKAYLVDILVSNEMINNCIYTATFNDNSIDDILQVIKESYKLNISKEDKTYTIDGEGC